eukprot:GHUV01036539.1.p2 GENE.GHUV01036539.1~~GHUV01036539.1.p2  ORF type:complete len:216 (+),score=120.53 GHUV01036539.1:1813-2460(+)
MSPDRTVPIPIKLHLPFQPSKRDRERHRDRQQRNSGSNLQPVMEGQEQRQQQQQLQQLANSSSSSTTQLQYSSSGVRPSSSSGGSSSSSSKAGLSQQAALQQQRLKAPVVHQIMAGGNSSIFLTRGPDEIPEVYGINLLEKLQQAVARASKKVQQGSDKMALASSLKMVSAGVEMVFGSAAAISAAFGYPDRVGLDVELLERTQQSILQLFSAEE